MWQPEAADRLDMLGKSGRRCVARALLKGRPMSPTRIAVYVIAILVAVFGVVFVADALVESDEERLEELEASLVGAAAGARPDRIAAWAATESVAVVADGRRTWVDADEGEATLRGVIDDALPELSDPEAEIVQHTSALTGRRGRITLRIRTDEGPVDTTLELALAEGAYQLIEVRRMR